MLLLFLPPPQPSGRFPHSAAPALCTPHPPTWQIYKDANHKPEMALAITEFEALCSFVPHEELLATLGSVPELAECCGPARVTALHAAVASPPGSPARRAALADAFHAVMACPPAEAEAFVERMCERLKAKAAAGQPLSPHELLALRLELQYPGDVGVLAAWFLNYLRLAPGEAVALPANEPHAYISGEIVEVMATSGEAWRSQQGCCGWLVGGGGGLGYVGWVFLKEPVE